MNPIFLASFTVAMIQTLQQPFVSALPSLVLELIFEGVFVTDGLLRFLSCPSRGGFVRDPFNLIDIISALPLVLRIAVNFAIPFEHTVIRHWISSVVLCCTPVLRLLRVLRRFEKFHLVLSAFNVALEALPVLLYTLSIIALGFSALIYLVEDRSNI